MGCEFSNETDAFQLTLAKQRIIKLHEHRKKQLKDHMQYVRHTIHFEDYDYLIESEMSMRLYEVTHNLKHRKKFNEEWDLAEKKAKENYNCRLVLFSPDINGSKEEFMIQVQKMYEDECIPDSLRPVVVIQLTNPYLCCNINIVKIYP